jgi:hypothetical protein
MQVLVRTKTLIDAKMLVTTNHEKIVIKCSLLVQGVTKILDRQNKHYDLKYHQLSDVQISFPVVLLSVTTLLILSV